MCVHVYILERDHSEGTRASKNVMLCVLETESYVCGLSFDLRVALCETCGSLPSLPVTADM